MIFPLYDDAKIEMVHSVEIVFRTPIHSFCFSLLVPYPINYMRYSTLYYKIGFELDDSDQL